MKRKKTALTSASLFVAGTIGLLSASVNTAIADLIETMKHSVLVPFYKKLPYSGRM